jgi:predicted ATP-dependent endonuclease of OLD family
MGGEMRLAFVEIENFRKLRCTRVDFSKDKTVFVGANNSGKTSAMVALRYFLVERERSRFSLTDFTLSHWPTIDQMGESWEAAMAADQPVPEPALEAVLPYLDVWLNVDDTEVHYVRKILPTLDWAGGLLGVRLRFEPRDAQSLQEKYLAARREVAHVQGEASTKGGGTAGQRPSVRLWPQSLTEFLERRLNSLFCVKAYVLDPDECSAPTCGTAQPQCLMDDSAPIDGDPFKGLVRVDEISAQRGFGQEDGAGARDDDANLDMRASGRRRLSEQLRSYYRRHLDPLDNPGAQDLLALKAVEEAQGAFDERLRASFSPALEEIETLGYPGVTDPRLHISSRLKPVDGLDHDSAVRYAIQMMNGEGVMDLYLPEDSNGLGYQNLISMVFRLMSFRDAWMRVGKAQARAGASEDDYIPPLHIVLIEEPEAHLHTQVQQVFIRQAYKILRNHKDLGDGSRFETQLIVSTHSSHLAHECEFESLRYFRRLPAKAGDVPTSCVHNLSDVFGSDRATKRFVTRYLKVTHCDLFFADAAVLIEGPAERILIPHFVREHGEFKDLAECYVTWLEIGGSHAHRLKSLIESLGLTTLIITDLDAGDEGGNATIPRRGNNQRTRNETLKTWCPATELLDDLVSKSAEDKVKSYSSLDFAVRVAYQCPVAADLKGKSAKVLPNTLEDALVFQNIELFKGLPGKGLLAKFRAAIEDSTTHDELAKSLLEALKSGGKAELALDLLEIEDAKALSPPDYIRDGLLWLLNQLRHHQERLGLVDGPLSDGVGAGKRNDATGS